MAPPGALFDLLSCPNVVCPRAPSARAIKRSRDVCVQVVKVDRMFVEGRLIMAAARDPIHKAAMLCGAADVWVGRVK